MDERRIKLVKKNKYRVEIKEKDKENREERM